MRRLFLLLLVFLSCCGLCSAHVVQQLFVDFSADKTTWKAEIRFDAGIALPEMRADKTALQPERQWLIEQTPAQQAELLKQAEIYLRSIMHFYWVNDSSATPMDFRVHFPEWDTQPPKITDPFTDMGFAYFTIECIGEIPTTGGQLEVRMSPGEHPDFAFSYERIGMDRIVTAYPGKSQILWTSTAEAPSAAQSFTSFLDYGFRHVLPGGWDHVLFIAALCFLSFAWRPLLTQSLVFTLGHTLTLALTITNVIATPPPAAMVWVEITIAATIIYVALENLFTRQLKRHRLLTIFLFGLVHGLGFASVLGETIRASGNIAMPLIAANLGVELGQVAVISAVLVSLFWARHKPYFSTIGKAASILIACTGSYWLIQRIASALF